MNRFHYWLISLAAIVLIGCTPTRELANEDPDPFEGYNRVMFAVNDAVDRAVFKPVAQAYRETLPDPVIASIGHFFSNMNDVVVFINDVLQFKLHQAAQDSSRIVFNTTFGLLGFFDVANRMELPKNREDFGQTLGVWGFGEGYYLVLPLLGPSTIRDTFGLVGDFLGNPINWAGDSRSVEWGLWGLDLVDRRARVLQIERALAEAQIDPYAFRRSAYLQHRRNLVHDGQVPHPEFDFANPDNPVE